MLSKKRSERDLIKELAKYNLRDALLEIGKVSEYLYANPDERSEMGNGFTHNDGKLVFTQESLAYLVKLLILSGANDTKILCLSKKKNKYEKLKDFFNRSGYLYYNVIHKSPELKESADGELNRRNSEIWNIQFFLHLWESQTKWQLQRMANRRHLLARQYLMFIKAYESLKNSASNSRLNLDIESDFKKKYSLSIRSFLMFLFLGISLDKELSWQRGDYRLMGCIDYRNLSWEGENLNEVNQHLSKINDSLGEDSIIKALMPFSLSYCEFKEKARELEPINPLMIYPLIRPDRKYKNRYPIFLSPVYPFLRNVLLEDGLFNALDEIYRSESGAKGVREFRSLYGELFEQFVKDIFINIYGREAVLDLDFSDKVTRKEVNSKKADLKITKGEKIYIIEIKSLKINYHFALKDVFDEDKIETNIKRLAEGVAQLYVESLNYESNIIPVLVIPDQAFTLVSSLYEDGNLMFKEKIAEAIKSACRETAAQQFLGEDFKFYILPLRYLEGNFNRLKNAEINLEDVSYKSDSKTVFFNPLGRVAERTSSRLRRTNDRSVRVISSDAEHATLMSYASKRKYKLDLSSLHEDHEDNENAEIGVPLHAPLGHEDKAAPSLDPDTENSNSYYDEAFEELMQILSSPTA